MIFLNPILNVFLLSLVAGLGTGRGGLIAVIRRPGKRSFGFLMGFTAGVMITLSFLELVNEAWELKGFWTATIGFAAGAFFMLLIDFAIPHIRFGIRETQMIEEPKEQEAEIRLLYRAGDPAAQHPGRHCDCTAAVFQRRL